MIIDLPLVVVSAGVMAALAVLHLVFRPELRNGRKLSRMYAIAALGGRILSTVPDLVGRVHEDYVRFMLASCNALLLACSRRRAARFEPAQQRMGRAA